jgi:hypothetical protein
MNDANLREHGVKKEGIRSICYQLDWLTRVTKSCTSTSLIGIYGQFLSIRGSLDHSKIHLGDSANPQVDLETDLSHYVINGGEGEIPYPPRQVSECFELPPVISTNGLNHPKILTYIILISKK